MIIVFNGLCNYGIVIAELLARYNLDCKVYTTQEVSQDYIKQLQYLSSDQIIYSDRQQLKKDMQAAKLCINVTTGAIDLLGLKQFICHIIVRRIKLINIPTGSDLSEIEIQPTIRKILFLYLLRTCTTHLPHYRNCIIPFFKHKAERFYFSRHPYLFQKRRKSQISKNKVVTFLHPSNLDWGETDNKPGRNSLKDNDLFLKAFIRAAKMLSKKKVIVKCLILDRGPDKDIAKKIINESGMEHIFEWLQPTNTIDLARYFTHADIVVDQFCLGIFGMTAMEAMAQGKPVMIYIDKNCWPLVYDEEPPAMNCHTEEEIYEAILKWADRKKLQELGNRAEKWVRRYHDVHTADFSEFILRVCLAAGLDWPRTDLAKADKI